MLHRAARFLFSHKPNLDNLFEKIVAREIPSEIVYEDDCALAFKDIAPVAPIHYLIIPKEKKNLVSLQQAEPHQAELLGHLLLVATKIAQAQALTEGYRLVINQGRHGCQTVHHLHVHMIAGEPLGWPPIQK